MATVTRESILALLETDQRAVERAVLVMQARQTADEQVGVTRHDNGRGWNAYDAAFGREMYDWIMLGTTPRDKTHTNGKGEARRGYGKALGTTLLPKQAAAVRKMLSKYVGQLLEEAQAKAANVQPATVQPATVQPATVTAPDDMLILVRAVIADAEGGELPENIAAYLAAAGWRVTAPVIATQTPPAAPQTSAAVDIDPEPLADEPAAVAQAEAAILAIADGEEQHYEDPGF